MQKKKSLGQNFFINKNLAEKIARTVQSIDYDILVEIGPGEGYFTNIFSKSQIQTILIEKDDNLATNLSIEYPTYTIINKDFLDWNFAELEKYKDKKICFFGSLPYNISKKIIKKIIKSEYFTQGFFIIQKEVADKYTQKEPNNNLLSLQTNIYANAKKLFDIKPESFNPKPKVTSSFIKFTKETNQEKDKENLYKFLEICFKQPRKTLKNNLKNKNFNSNDTVNKILEKRPQHLSLDQYIYLFNNLN